MTSSALSWPQKPFGGTPIDRAHPYARGMQSFTACNDGAGYPWDQGLQRNWAHVSGTAATVWNSTQWGYGFNSVLGAGQVLSLTAPTPFDCGQNITAIMWFNFTSFQASSPFISTLFCWGSNNQICRFGDSTISNNQLEITYNGTTKAHATVTASLGLNCIAMTITPSVSGSIVQAAYLNGVQVVSQSQLYTQMLTAITYLFSDAGATNDNRQPGGSLIDFGFWTQWMPASQILLLSNMTSAWQMFQGGAPTGAIATVPQPTRVIVAPRWEPPDEGSSRFGHGPSVTLLSQPARRWTPTFESAPPADGAVITAKRPVAQVATVAPARPRVIMPPEPPPFDGYAFYAIAPSVATVVMFVLNLVDPDEATLITTSGSPNYADPDLASAIIFT